MPAKETIRRLALLPEISDLLVGDLDSNGSKEFVALVGSGALYTWDGPTRQLRNLRQGTDFTLLGSAVSAAGLVGGDSTGRGHFLQYSKNSYKLQILRTLGPASLDGITILSNQLWAGVNGFLNLRLAPDYKNPVVWQSPVFGTGFGRYVATSVYNGEKRIFSSALHAVAGFIYTLP